MIPRLMLGIACTLVSIPTTVYSELPQRGVCAHRGASKSHPENTLPALREAVRLGASMIEFDVQVARDGTLVLMHDTTVDRTTNGHGKVSELDWPELRKLDAGSWKGKAFEGVTIPQFEEALAVFPRDVWLNCHLKGGAEVGKKAAEALAKTNRLHQAFLAAESDAARGAKEAVPNVMICNMDRQSDTVAYAQATLAMGAAFIQLRGQGEIPRDAIRVLQGSSVRINYYHDESPEGLRRLWDAGVHFPLVDDLESALGHARAYGLEVPAPKAHVQALLPKKVDLRSHYDRWKMPPRSQGQRNTCSVFVTVGAFEYALSRKLDRAVPLSVEYANWACNRMINNQSVDRGQFFHDLLRGYERYGMCLETLMPYEDRFQNTTPTEEARTDAQDRKKLPFQVHWIKPWSKSAQVADDQMESIYQTLAAGWPVCAGSDHSRLLVGYELDGSLPGGGRLITRDSGLGSYSEVSIEWGKSHFYDLFWVGLE